MVCLLALLALISPRLVLFLLWIFSNVLSRAFDSWIVPLLGFFLLPWTTLTYAAFWDWGSGHHVTGFEWFFVILAFLIFVVPITKFLFGSTYTSSLMACVITFFCGAVAVLITYGSFKAFSLGEHAVNGRHRLRSRDRPVDA